VLAQMVVLVHNVVILEADFPIYTATVPFGIYTQEGSGGGLFFAFSFRWSSTESYVVKYWDDHLLKTEVFESEETPLYVDGTFRLHGRFIERRCYLLVLPVSIRQWWEFTVHIPYVPENVTRMTEDWHFK
jgi:hypothetical protein